MEKQSIINLSRYWSKGYASIVLGDSEVNVSWEREGCSLLYIYLLSFIYRHRCMIEEVCHQISLSFILLEVFCHGLLLFCPISSSFSINYSSLVSCWLSIILPVIPQGFLSRFLKCSLYLFFLTDSFWFWFQSALPSAHFICCLSS